MTRSPINIGHTQQFDRPKINDLAKASFLSALYYLFSSIQIAFQPLCLPPRLPIQSIASSIVSKDPSYLWNAPPALLSVNDRSFETIEEAIYWIGEWAATQGYGFSNGHSWSNTQCITPKVRFRCQRGQKYRDRRRKRPVDDDTPSRNTTRLSANCPSAGELCFNFVSRRCISTKDIENFKSRYHQEKLDGLTPFTSSS
ncbi:hypothetical protein PCH_Pc21g09280 [Penicillium rubens Wisconsin 54-1255]|uniref:Uncharacterized protein n=1 Tax=Penicillium rubens (strain ATCC 28089 / DSM 1075 / NRRL 1951 / Wisconsin 54-1255) TaxID=500485 RepID=B6HN88_PENRW|nr:hypothetical protein PCH_Pc21g09280 [Penicillium rubens Wisconsin 54-1255]